MFLKGIFILVGCLLTVVETNPVKHQGWAINRTKTDKATKTLTAEERYEDVKISAEHHRQITTAVRNNGATCYDRRLSDIINTGLGYFSHDMGQLSKYILDQIVRARYSGNWLVHAEMIGNQRQGFEWQSATNGDLFARTSRNGCYYHDTQTYLIVVRY